MNRKFYYCKHCGNFITFIEASGAPVICCGETELEPNTVDAAVEKHVPVVKREGNKVTVLVGEVDHPMTSEHHIAWIALDTGNALYLKTLTPEDAPKAEFLLEEGTEFTAYAYCNLHGLWKK